MAVQARADGQAGPQYISIAIEGEIDERMVARVKTQLDAAPHASTLRMRVNSNGGNLHSALRIYNAICEHPASRKSARAAGRCQSAALVAFLACDHREAAAGVLILTHEAAVSPVRNRRWTRGVHQSAADRLHAADEAILDLICERTGATRATVRTLMEADENIHLVRALSVGLIHEFDGCTRPCSRDWPERVRNAWKTQAVVVGMPNYLFSPGYLAACAATLRRQP